MSERKVSYIGKIIDIQPIKGADFIVSATVVCGEGGKWVGTVRKNDFKVDDIVEVYLQDALVPKTKEFEFMEEYKYRVTMRRFRQVPSECLIMPMSLNMTKYGIVGTSIDDAKEVIKYEKPIPACLSGLARGNFPTHLISKTDEPNFQTAGRLVHALKGQRYYATVKADGCLPAHAYISLWNGGSKKIIDIVNSNNDYILIGMNEEGKYIPTKVLNSFNNGTKDKWIDISFKKFPPTIISGCKSKKIRITENHQILVKKENSYVYLPAKNLKSNDIVCTPYKTPSVSVMHMIRSSLLGDGYIGSNGYNFYFSEGHSNKEYSNKIKEWLGDFHTYSDERISGYKSKIFINKSKYHEYLNELRKLWYKDGKKNGRRIPNDLSWIDDFTIAKWYMDDGSLLHIPSQRDRAIFHTHRFYKTDVEKLSKKIEKMYNVKCYINNNKGWYITVGIPKNKTLHKFWSRISPHIIPSMRYKLPREYRNVQYQEYPKGKFELNNYETVIDTVNYVEINKKNFPHGRCGFDLETETHNFVANGILVHNSSGTIYKHDNHFGCCSRNLELKEDTNPVVWRLARKYDIERILPDDIGIQFEMVGPGIQGNRMKLDEIDMRVFNIWSIKERKYFDANYFRDFCEVFKLPTVEIITWDEIFNFEDNEALRKFAEGRYTGTKEQREGVVFRPMIETKVGQQRLSFKVINLLYKD